MIPSHKRILLHGFGEKLGVGDAKDNVKVSCAGGQIGSAVNAMVLGSIAPWLSQALTDHDPDDSVVVFPDVSADDWLTFTTNLMTDKDFFHVDEVRDLRRAAYNICSILRIDYFGSCLEAAAVMAPDIIDSVDDEDNEDEEEEDDDAFEEQELVDPMTLDDQTLIENFSDQEQRLVCLVCYQIFTAIQHQDDNFCQSFRTHLASHTKSALKEIRIRRFVDDQNSSSAAAAAGKEYLLDCAICASDVTRLADVTAPATRYGTMESLVSHHNSAHGKTLPLQARLCCVQCDYTCPSYAGISCHMRSHQERKFECTVCHQKFLQKTRLETHKKKGRCHPDNRKCSHCDRVFATVTALNLHVRKLKLPPDGDEDADDVTMTSSFFECQVCKKKFLEKRSLKEHYLTHRRERQHVCNFCGKAFVQKNHLLYHLASAHDSAPDGQASKHVCKICSRSFAFPFLLKKHEAGHVKRLVNHFKTAEAALTNNSGQTGSSSAQPQKQGKKKKK